MTKLPGKRFLLVSDGTASGTKIVDADHPDDPSFRATKVEVHMVLEAGFGAVTKTTITVIGASLNLLLNDVEVVEAEAPRIDQNSGA